MCIVYPCFCSTRSVLDALWLRDLVGKKTLKLSSSRSVSMEALRRSILYTITNNYLKVMSKTIDRTSFACRRPSCKSPLHFFGSHSYIFYHPLHSLLTLSTQDTQDLRKSSSISQQHFPPSTLAHSLHHSSPHCLEHRV